MSKKVLFIGNRSTVIENMFNLDIDIVRILCVRDSYLQKYLISKKIKFDVFQSKNELINFIRNTEFDILVSNGCPYILPVSCLKKEGQIFINIHPALLPYIRGKHPINAALLFDKSAGATCHLMDDKIDTGDIISQIKIDVTDDIDLGLLYKLSFMAEGEAFIRAYERNFYIDYEMNDKIKNQPENSIYYTRKDEDLRINFSSDSNSKILKKIRAFSIQSQEAFFMYKNNKFKVYDAEEIINPYLLKKVNCYKENQIAIIYENNIILKREESFIKLVNINGNMDILNELDIIVD